MNEIQTICKKKKKKKKEKEKKMEILYSKFYDYLSSYGDSTVLLIGNIITYILCFWVNFLNF